MNNRTAAVACVSLSLLCGVGGYAIASWRASKTIDALAVAAMDRDMVRSAIATEVFRGLTESEIRNSGFTWKTWHAENQWMFAETLPHHQETMDRCRQIVRRSEAMQAKYASYK